MMPKGGIKIYRIFQNNFNAGLYTYIYIQEIQDSEQLDVSSWWPVMAAGLFVIERCVCLCVCVRRTPR